MLFPSPLGEGGHRPDERQRNGDRGSVNATAISLLCSVYKSSGRDQSRIARRVKTHAPRRLPERDVAARNARNCQLLAGGSLRDKSTAYGHRVPCRASACRSPPSADGGRCRRHLDRTLAPHPADRPATALRLRSAPPLRNLGRDAISRQPRASPGGISGPLSRSRTSLRPRSSPPRAARNFSQPAQPVSRGLMAR